MRVKSVFGVLALGALFVLGGCTSTVERPAEGAGAEDGAAAEAGPGAEAGAADMDEGFQGSPLEGPDSPLSKRVFYFPYDSDQVSVEDRDTLIAHARYLSEHPEISVVVEGHADERGSREYNLALGERRAQSVEQLLLLQGATREQLQVISFGEERPVAMGHDESAWRLNRRVELLYSGY